MRLLMAVGASAPEPEPLLAWDKTIPINVVVDGNSHYAQWVYPAINTVGEFGALMARSGASSSNFAVPGQTWSDMALNASSTDAAWVAGKVNVLVCGEGTNTFHGGGTGAPVRTTVEDEITDARQFIAGRLARNPWRVVLCGTIPRGGRTEDAPKNALTKSSDDYKAANFRDMGAHAYCDFRASPYFDGDGNSTASTIPWMGVSGLCQETAAPFIHPIGAPRTAFAGRIAAALQTLPAL